MRGLSVTEQPYKDGLDLDFADTEPQYFALVRIPIYAENESEARDRIRPYLDDMQIEHKVVIHRMHDRKLMGLFECLAAIEHDRWSDWQRNVHDRGTKNADGSITLAASDVERWERQIKTEYSELSCTEQELDREQVRRYWNLIQQELG